MITTIQALALAHAIYIAEGGSNTKFSYGIIPKHSYHNTSPKQACLNTIVRFYNRTHPTWYLDRTSICRFSEVYCPTSVDKAGNKNWKKNVTKILHL